MPNGKSFYSIVNLNAGSLEELNECPFSTGSVVAVGPNPIASVDNNCVQRQVVEPCQSCHMNSDAQAIPGLISRHVTQLYISRGFVSLKVT